MTTTLLVFHLIIVLLLIGVILLQRSSQEGFTGGGGANAMMSGRGKKTLLSRVTAILAAIFIANSLLLAFIYSHKDRSGGLIDSLTQEEATNSENNSTTNTMNAEDAQTEAVRKLLENSTKGVTVTGTNAKGVEVKVQDSSPAEVPIAE